MITYGYIWKETFFESRHNCHIQYQAVTGQLGSEVEIYGVGKLGVYSHNVYTKDLIRVDDENKDQYSEYMI